MAGRPGTPDAVQTWVRSAPLDRPPEVCVRFHNTATVNVGFFVDWAKNGQRLTGKDLQGNTTCVGAGAAYSSSCTAQSQIARQEGASVRPGEAPQVMCLRESEADTEYCFRFRSFDSDGLWSAYWSPVSCARTPPSPQAPPAPGLPSITLVPAETGRGVPGLGQPARVLLEWGPPATGIDGVGRFIVQQRKSDGSRWTEVPEQITGLAVFPDSMHPQATFEVLIPFPRDPPSDLLRYEFRVCSMNYGGIACSAGRKTELGLQQQARSDVKLTESGFTTPNVRIRNQLQRSASDSGTSAPPTARVPETLPDLNALAVEGEALAAGDVVATSLRESLAEGEARRGFDIAMAAARGQTQWGPGKQKILDSLGTEAQTGFKIAISYLFDLNRYVDRARIGAHIAEVDPEVAERRSADGDARFTLGFDIASAIFGDSALGAQGNTAAGPGSLGIRNSLSAPAQRGFDAAMQLHLSRRYR
jgi:hypothetical protein